MDSNNLHSIKQEKWDKTPYCVGSGLICLEKYIKLDDKYITVIDDVAVKVFKMQPENTTYLYFNNFDYFLNYMKTLKFKKKDHKK